MKEASIVRQNLMDNKDYRPYCGNTHFVRLIWDGEQFTCSCGYRTEFPEDFIKRYKAKWHKT